MAPTAPPAGLRIIRATRGWAMGEFEYCIAVVWSDQPDAEAMELRATELAALCARSPGRAALVEIVEPTSKPPSDDTRRVAMEVFRKLGSRLSGIGFVVEGSEMRSALTRAIITGMLFFVKQPQPAKVFRRIEDMVEWARQRLVMDDPTFPSNLTSSLEHLRALMHAMRAA